MIIIKHRDLQDLPAKRGAFVFLSIFYVSDEEIESPHYWMALNDRRSGSG